MIKIFKIITLALLILISTNLFAQESEQIKEIKQLYINKNYDLTIKSCNKILANNKSQEDYSKLFYFKGLSNFKLYEKDKKSTFLDSSYLAFNKSLEYDKIKELTPEINEYLIEIASKYVYKGVDEFNAANYKNALVSFEKTIAINSRPAIMQLDTIIIYNAAMSAEKLQKYDLAIKYYSDLINYKYGDEQIFVDLATIYRKTNKIDEYFATLNRGEQQFPTNHQKITTEYANYYLLKGNYNKALEYLKVAIKDTPYNASIYYVSGSVYEELNNKEEAIKSYEKAIAIDSAYTDALYNLSVIYYNDAIKIKKSATSKDQLKKSNDLFNKSLLLLEKANISQPNDKDILTLLRSIYSILKMPTKVELINNKLLNLK